MELEPRQRAKDGRSCERTFVGFFDGESEGREDGCRLGWLDGASVCGLEDGLSVVGS